MNGRRRLASVSPIRFGRSFLRCCPIVAVSLLAVTWGGIAGQPQAKTKGPEEPPSRSPGEPLASALSLTKARAVPRRRDAHLAGGEEMRELPHRLPLPPGSHRQRRPGGTRRTPGP